MSISKLMHPIQVRRGTLAVGLFALALVTMGSGTCVVVEEGPPGIYEEPGINAERMEDQEIEVTEGIDGVDEVDGIDP